MNFTKYFQSWISHSGSTCDNLSDSNGKNLRRDKLNSFNSGTTMVYEIEVY